MGAAVAAAELVVLTADAQFSLEDPACDDGASVGGG